MNEDMAKEKYLVKIGSQLRVIPSKELDEFTLTEALMIGVASVNEQRKQLLRDAIDGDRYYYGRKVVDGLELSVSKLQEKFPEIKQQMKKLALGDTASN